MVSEGRGRFSWQHTVALDTGCPPAGVALHAPGAWLLLAGKTWSCPALLVLPSPTWPPLSCSASGRRSAFPSCAAQPEPTGLPSVVSCWGGLPEGQCLAGPRDRVLQIPYLQTYGRLVLPVPHPHPQSRFLSCAHSAWFCCFCMWAVGAGPGAAKLTGACPQEPTVWPASQRWPICRGVASPAGHFCDSDISPCREAAS